jgi:ribosomal protein S18 acetylase RimI-like enzyme
MSDAESLQIVSRMPVRKRRYWYSAYEDSSDFEMPWWRDKYVSEPSTEDHWVSIVLREREVARCKYVMTGPRADTVLGDLPHGQLDILAFEVAVSMRRKGIGRAAVQAIQNQNPLPRLTALNDGVESRKFWDGIGWIRHEPAHAIFRGVERVTYSEP